MTMVSMVCNTIALNTYSRDAMALVSARSTPGGLNQLWFRITTYTLLDKKYCYKIDWLNPSVVANV